jgi:anaerobic magnesium-protoporphyrin IX monomethyl ester cyclase
MEERSCGSKGKSVLLMMPPFREYNHGKWKSSESPSPPLGLMYLATPLIHEGYNVNFIDLSVEELDRQQYFDILRRSNFILITCFTRALVNVKKIINDIKKINKNAYIITGGPYCTETETYIEGSDMSVFGEADLVIDKILDLISSKKSLDGIPGLCYKKNGKLVRNPGTLLVEDLDLIEPPSLDLAKNKNYGCLYGVRIDNVITPILTSRGCPFDCSFCTYRRTKYRTRSVDNVSREIKMRVEAGSKYLAFYDDNFLLNKPRAMDLMDKIIENKFKLKIILMGRADSVDYELYKKLREAGVFLIIFGIESANQDVLDFFNKKTTVEKTKESITMANKVGIITFGNLIIGAPMEEKRHFDTNKKFFKEVPLDLLSMHILKYIYGSHIWNDALQKGLIKKDEIAVEANEKLSNFSTEELTKVQKELIKSFYNSPKRILRLIYKSLKIFGIGIVYLLFKMYVSKAIYRTSDKFHQAALKNHPT